MECLDGPLGDRLSALSVTSRQLPEFGQACESVEGLLAAVLKHAAAQGGLMRCVRRLVAALLPVEEEEEEGEEEAEEGEEEGEEEEEEETSDGLDAMEAGEDKEEEEAQPKGDAMDEGSAEGEDEEESESSGSEGEEGQEAVARNAGDNVGKDDGAGGDAEGEGEASEDVEGEGSDMDKDLAGEVGDGDAGAPCKVAAGGAGGKTQAAAAAEGLRQQEAELRQAALAELPRVSNPAARAATLLMLQQVAQHPLLHHLAAGAGQADAGCGAPLPEYASQVAVPLTSVLELVATTAQDGEQAAAEGAGSAATPGPGDSGYGGGWGSGWNGSGSNGAAGVDADRAGSSGAAAVQAGLAGGGGEADPAVELLLLLEGLLNMCRSLADTHPTSHTHTRATADPEEDEETEGGGAEGAAAVASQGDAHWPAPRSSDAEGLAAMLRLLQCCYGATCSARDQACLRLLFTLDALLQGARAVGGVRAVKPAGRLHQTTGLVVKMSYW